MPRAVAALLVAALVGLSLGCQGDDKGQPVPDDSPQAVEPSIELVQVPDVIGEDGQDAVDAIEAEGLTASHDELDPTGCTVEDQDETGEVEPETEVVLTLDCRQRDWESREGDDWDLFASSFAVGAGEGCEALFSLSPNGALYADDDEYTSTECSLATYDDPESASVTIPAEVPDDSEAVGESLGFDHGCNALFDQEAIDVLSYGTDDFTADDCMAAGE